MVVGGGKLCPIKDNFPALAGPHESEAGLKFGHRKVVRDHWGNIETALHQGRHFVPSFKHFSAVNAFKVEHFENNFIPVDLARP